MTGAPETVHRASTEIAALRDDLGRLVDELDRRRHEAFDIPLQLKRHPAVVIVAVGAVAVAIGAMIAVGVRNRRRRHRVGWRARETRRALSRLIDHPDRVAAEPNLAQKILAAAGTAAGSMLAKRFVARLVPDRP